MLNIIIKRESNEVTGKNTEELQIRLNDIDSGNDLSIIINNSTVDIYRLIEYSNYDHQRVYLSMFNNFDDFAMYVVAEAENFCPDKASDVNECLANNRELISEKMFNPRYKSRIKHFNFTGVRPALIRDDDFGKYDVFYTITLSEAGIWFAWPDYYYDHEDDKWDINGVKSYFYKYEWLNTEDDNLCMTLFNVILDNQDIRGGEVKDSWLDQYYNSQEIENDIQELLDDTYTENKTDNVSCYIGQDNCGYNPLEIAMKISDSLELVTWN